MKYILFFILLLVPLTASAGQGVHHNNNEKYVCSVSGKPGKIKTVSLAKTDLRNDGRLKLRWSDSLTAHKVEISLNGRIVKTEDDGRKTIAGLKGKQEVKVRGTSNCGKGEWTKTYIFIP